VLAFAAVTAVTAAGPAPAARAAAAAAARAAATTPPAAAGEPVGEAGASTVGIVDTVGRPNDLAGVAFGRAEQAPLVEELRRIDAEYRDARDEADAADAELDDDRGELARLETALADAEATTSRANERRDRASAARDALAEPLAAARELMGAMAIDAYVHQDIDASFDPTAEFDADGRRRAYLGVTWGTVRADWAELSAARDLLVDEAERAAATEAEARADGRRLTSAAEEAEAAAEASRDRAAAAEAKLEALRLQASALWAGIVDIGRRPLPPPTIGPASPTADEIERLTSAALYSVGLGPVASYGDYDFSEVVLDAYVLAAEQMSTERPGCHLRWELLAGIGRVESFHGRIFGNSVGEDGNVRPGIRGPALDGVSFALIRDSDGGRWDGDTVHDRAVGPMQFIPTSWQAYGRDGNLDGAADPHNYFDAALAAAELLCSHSYDLRTGNGLYRAVLSYNASTAYVTAVLGHMARYGELGLPAGHVARAPSQSGPLPPISFPPDPTPVGTSTTSTTSSTAGPASATSTSATSTTATSTTATSTTATGGAATGDATAASSTTTSSTTATSKTSTSTSATTPSTSATAISTWTSTSTSLSTTMSTSTRGAAS